MIAAVLATIAAVSVLALGGVRYGLPALAHAKHERCLVRIALLEHELGMSPAQPTLTSLGERALKWRVATEAKQANYTAPRPRYRALVDDNVRLAVRAQDVARAEFVMGRRQDDRVTAADVRAAKRGLRL